MPFFLDLCKFLLTFSLEQLELEVIEGNQRAIGLYHKMGFVCTGEKPNAIRLEDGSSLKELMMVKVL